jgi:carbonic anhydrase
MEKVLHFDSQAGDYQADACVVSCFDARFDAAVRKFLKRRGVLMVDHIKIAGASRWLASPEYEADRDFVLRQIRTSMARHGSERVILFLHSDCGAYGGLAAFGGDHSKESALLRGDLARASAFVQANEPSLAVETYLLDFDGVWCPALAARG